MRSWLALLIPLMIVGSCLADDGIPLNTDFDLPVVVGGKALVGRAFVNDAKVMRIYYAQDGKVAGPIVYTLVRGSSPQPGPEPKPKPTPEPTPTPVGPMSVMVVYNTDSLDNLPTSQASIYTSKDIRAYLDAHCAREPVKLPDGKAAQQATWRFMSHAADVSKLSAKAQAWHAELKTRKLPSIKISNGATEYVGDLPATVDETIAMLRKYGG
jgi:hypothetical protein